MRPGPLGPGRAVPSLAHECSSISSHRGPYSLSLWSRSLSLSLSLSLSPLHHIYIHTHTHTHIYIYIYYTHILYVPIAYISMFILFLTLAIVLCKLWSLVSVTSVTSALRLSYHGAHLQGPADAGGANIQCLAERARGSFAADRVLEN